MGKTKITTVAYKIENSSDDCYSTSSTLTNSATLEMGNNGSAVGIACRYQIYVPKRSTIKTAKLRFVSNATSSNTDVILKIQAEYTRNPNAPTTGTDFSGRTLTTSYTDWKGIPSWTSGKIYETPNFNSVLQEVIDKSDWAQGNYVIIFVKDNGSSASAKRTAYSFDDGTNGAWFQPRLIVEYETPENVLNSIPKYGDNISWIKSFNAIYYGSEHTEKIPNKPELSLFGSGDLSGLYRYRISLTTGDQDTGEFVESPPSDIQSIFTNSSTVRLSIEIPESNFSGYRIYRTSSNEFTFYLLRTIINPTSPYYIDNNKDSSLVTNISPIEFSRTSMPFLFLHPMLPIDKKSIPEIRFASAIYTVPTGKLFHLCNINSGNSGGASALKIRDTVSGTNKLLWAPEHGDSTEGTTNSRMFSSVPVKTEIEGTFSMQVSGFLSSTNDGRTPLIKSITNASTYTVPNGKIFLLTGIGLDETEVVNNGKFSASAGNPSVPISIPSGNCRVIDMVAVQGGGALTKNAAQTLIWTRNSNATHASTGMSYKDLTGSSTQNATMSWTAATAGLWAASTVAIRPNGTITQDSTVNAETATSSATLTSPSITIAANSNRLLIVGVYTRGSNVYSNSVISVKLDGTTNLKRIRHDNRHDARTELWYLIAPATGTHTVTVTTERVTDITMGCVSIYNCQQEVNEVALEVRKQNTGNWMPILPVGFRGTQVSPVPSYMVFNETDVLRISSTISTGVVIYGYEIYKNF